MKDLKKPADKKEEVPAKVLTAEEKEALKQMHADKKQKANTNEIIRK